MEMKFKENVNYDSFTFRKRVIGEALDLIGRKRNYITNDIYFITMITFVNNIIEDDIIIDTLYETDKLEEKITKTVEPIFNEKVLGDENAKRAFDEIAEDIVEYIDRDVYSRESIGGFLYDIMEDLGEMNLPALSNMLVEISKMAKKQFGNLTKDDKPRNDTGKTDSEIRDEALESIDNAKMKALIESFSRKEGVETSQEEIKVENTAE